MKRRKVIKVGLDFDGVVTYNPMRVARVAVSFLKHRVLKIRKLGFFVPKNQWQRWIYYLGIVIPSWFPARGLKLLKQMSQSKKYEFYLLSGRYGFAKENTYDWLDKHQISGVFKKIYINQNNEQPHKFKLKVLADNHFDYFVEDNLDIVRDLSNRRLKTKVYWIYNLIDGWKDYPYKFPFLEKALEKINEDSI